MDSMTISFWFRRNFRISLKYGRSGTSAVTVIQTIFCVQVIVWNTLQFSIEPSMPYSAKLAFPDQAVLCSEARLAGNFRVMGRTAIYNSGSPLISNIAVTWELCGGRRAHTQVSSGRGSVLGEGTALVFECGYRHFTRFSNLF